MGKTATKKLIISSIFKKQLLLVAVIGMLGAETVFKLESTFGEFTVNPKLLNLDFSSFSLKRESSIFREGSLFSKSSSKKVRHHSNENEASENSTFWSEFIPYGASVRVRSNLPIPNVHGVPGANVRVRAGLPGLSGAASARVSVPGLPGIPGASARVSVPGLPGIPGASVRVRAGLPGASVRVRAGLPGIP